MNKIVATERNSTGRNFTGVDLDWGETWLKKVYGEEFADSPFYVQYLTTFW